MFGRHYFGARNFGPRYFGDGGNEPPIPPAPVVSNNSGGYYEVPQVKRHRTVQEERELLGIVPKRVKQVIEQVAEASIAAEKTDTQAGWLLQTALAKQDIQAKPQYEALMQQERDRILNRDIQLALGLRAKWKADQEDEDYAVEMLLL